MLFRSRRLPYATHMRNEDDQLLDSIDESIAVARGAGCPLQISHLKTQGPRNWNRLDTVFRRIEESRRGGLDVAFDRYPYIELAVLRRVARRKIAVELNRGSERAYGGFAGAVVVRSGHDGV